MKKQNWLYVKDSDFMWTSLWTKVEDLRARPWVEKVNMLASFQLSFKWDLGVLHNLLVLYGNTGVGPTLTFNFSSHSVSSTQFHEYVENIEKEEIITREEGDDGIVN